MAEQTVPFQTENPAALMAERRAWVRFRNESDISCASEEANTAWLGRIQDVSPGGIALTVRRRFEPEASLTVELATKTGEPRRFIVRVVHATQATDGRWTIGCAFARPLGDEELQTLFGETTDS
jgi:hypothetical protein